LKHTSAQTTQFLPSRMGDQRYTGYMHRRCRSFTPLQVSLRA
jgi:hypothetical protein